MFLKLLNLLLPISNVVYLYYINLEPSKFGLFTIIFISINLFFTLLFLFSQKPSPKATTNLFAYFLFVLSLVACFIFIKNDILKIITYIVGFLMSFLSLMHVRYLITHNRENYFLNDVDYYIFLFSSFLATNSLFAFNIFLGLNKFLLTILAFIYFFIFYFCIYYYHTKNLKDVYKHIFTSSIVSSEVFVVSSFLPYSFYVDAIIVLLFNFVLSSTIKDYLANKFSESQFKKIVVLLLFLLAVVLITAKRT